MGSISWKHLRRREEAVLSRRTTKNITTRKYTRGQGLSTTAQAEGSHTPEAQGSLSPCKPENKQTGAPRSFFYKRTQDLSHHITNATSERNAATTQLITNKYLTKDLAFAAHILLAIILVKKLTSHHTADH